MRFLNWLRNVTVARHIFIFITFAIFLMCLYVYTFVYGNEKNRLNSIIFFAIIAVFIVHLCWILIATLFHFIKKEWKAGIYKIILSVLYAILIYFIYGFSINVFYGVATTSDYKIYNSV